MPHQNGTVALVENNKGWVVYLDLYVGTRMGSQGEPDQSGQGYSSRWMTAFGRGGAPTRSDLPAVWLFVVCASHLGSWEACKGVWPLTNLLYDDELTAD